MIEVGEESLPGVNLVGFLHGESGLGEIARKLGRALDHAGIPFSAIPYRRTPSRQEHPVSFETSGVAAYDTNLISINPNELATFAHDVGLELFATRLSIGFWFWETNVFPREYRPAFLYLDEVWVPSAYVRDAVEREADIPVHMAPLPVEPPARTGLSRTDLGLPPGYVFLYVFDFVSAERKNPLGVVEAFRRAFAPGEGPTLVLKSINGRERKPALLEQVRSAVADRADIQVLDGYVSAEERDAFLATCDCFVSLHRSEGFGLTMAEAMSHGKPVIATAYSGNLEFMDEESAYLVPYRLVPIPPEWWAAAPGAHWAEPDIDAATEFMRVVWERQDAARRLGERGMERLLARLSVDRAAAFVQGRFTELRRRSAVRASRHVRETLLEAAQGLHGGIGAGLTDAGPVGRARRLLARALWPELVARYSVDSALLQAAAASRLAVDALESRVTELEERLRGLDDAGEQVAPDSALLQEK